MKKISNVLTGEVKTAKDNTIFQSKAIGSCVVIAGYDTKEMVGAMAHVMLPGVSPEKNSGPRTRYAANAIEEMIGMMIRLGTDRENIEVCLVGGANVLKREDDTICQANIDSVIEILHKEGIKIKAKYLGGFERMSVSLDTEKSKVFHSVGDGTDDLLLCF